MRDAAPYLRSGFKYRPLRLPEVRKLVRKARAGDSRAMDEVVRAHLPLVPFVLRRLLRRTQDREGLIQEGNRGLLIAITKYDLERPILLSTYASWWIRACALRAMQQEQSVASTGRTRLGRIILGQDVSLDATGDDSGSLLDLQADPSPSPEERAASSERSARIRAILDQGEWTPLEHDLIKQRLAAESPTTLREFAKRWGRSPERIRQLETPLRLRLQRILRTEYERLREGV